MKGMSGSIIGGFLATSLGILIYLNPSWLLIEVVAASLITGGLAATVSETRDNFAGILLGGFTAITIAIPLTNPVQGIHILGLVLGILSSYLVLNSISEY